MKPLLHPQILNSFYILSSKSTTFLPNIVLKKRPFLVISEVDNYNHPLWNSISKKKKSISVSSSKKK